MRRPGFIHACVLAAIFALPVFAQNAATNPVPRNASRWLQRHDGFRQLAQKGGIDLLFLGDSITDGWRARGSNVWNTFYASRKAANFGISGDQTQHVLWRIQNGELDQLKPRVIVLMIGTNNSGRDDGKSIADGIRSILEAIRSRCPDSKVLLLAIFPRNMAADSSRQLQAIADANEIIAGFDDGRRVRFLNINQKLVGPDGKVPAAIMPDFLHPNANGYQIWADAMEPTLAEMLK
jgi:lysophospholipase L1-like esterase